MGADLLQFICKVNYMRKRLFVVDEILQKCKRRQSRKFSVKIKKRAH